MALSFSSSGRAGLATSLGLHALMLVGLVVLVRPAPLPESGEQVVMVELVTTVPPVVARAAAEPLPEMMAPGASADAEAPLAQQEEPQLIEATTMMAAAALADPRNAEARRALGMIATEDRREQICGIEAMEQLRAGRPDLSVECIIAYAFADTFVEDGRLIATGAAMQSGSDWYRLEYDCMPGADLASVTAFRYRIGDPVSEEERDRAELAPCH